MAAAAAGGDAVPVTDGPHDDGTQMGCSGGGACATPAAPQHQRSRWCVQCDKETRRPAKCVWGVDNLVCAQCFTTLYTRRVRSFLKRCGSRFGTPLVLGFSGGAASRSLLHMMANLQYGPGRFGDVIAVHVDTSVLSDLHGVVRNDADTQAAVEETLRIATASGVPVVHTRLEDVYLPEQRMAQSPPGGPLAPLLPAVPEAVDSLCALFAAASATDAKVDLLDAFTRQVLNRVAAALDRKYLMLGTCGTRIAEKLMEYTCKGKGYSLPLHAAVSEWRDGRTFVGQPLIDLPSSNAALFCRYNKLDTVFHPTYTTLKPPRDSIAALTESFLATLTAGFPGTISHVLKTAGKLRAPVPVAAIGSGATLPTTRHDRSTKLEGMLATATAACKLCPVCRDLVPNGGVPPSAIHPSAPDPVVSPPSGDAAVADVPLRQVVCRGCQHVLDTLGSAGQAALPPVVSDRAAEVAPRLRPMSTAEMRDKAADCLL